MKLAITLKFAPVSGVDMDLVWEAERLGYEAVWAGEAYGTDAVTPVAWVLAQTKKIKAGTSIMQMPARTPTCAAMTAMTLQAMSGNRFSAASGHPARKSSRAGTVCRSASRFYAPGNTSRSFAGSWSARPRSSSMASTIRSPIPDQALPGSASRSGASSTATPV